MKKEIKEKWIKELRSGKHRQTIGKLKARNGAMCCLGVLEHVVIGKKYEWDGQDYVNEDDCYEWPSEETRGICLASEDSFSDLSQMNDTGSSFDEIADYIQENL